MTRRKQHPPPPGHRWAIKTLSTGALMVYPEGTEVFYDPTENRLWPRAMHTSLVLVKVEEVKLP